MVSHKNLMLSLLCFVAYMYQPNATLIASSSSNSQKSVSGLADMIMPYVAANNTTYTIGIIANNGYTASSDWKNYICPALNQVGASKEFIQFVAYTMGFTKERNNKMYDCNQG